MYIYSIIVKVERRFVIFYNAVPRILLRRNPYFSGTLHEKVRKITRFFVGFIIESMYQATHCFRIAVKCNLLYIANMISMYAIHKSIFDEENANEKKCSKLYNCSSSGKTK